MTQIQLLPTDDIIAARGKLLESSSKVITMIIPTGSNLITVFPYKLLLKSAHQSGKTLNFSTNDPTIQKVIELVKSYEVETKPQNHESSLSSNQLISHPSKFSMLNEKIDPENAQDIKHFESPQLEEINVISKSESDRRNQKSLSKKKKIIKGTILTICILLSIGIIFYLYKLITSPSAEINLVIESTSIRKSLEVTAVENATGVDLNQRTLPVSAKKLTKEVTLARNTTGTTTTGEKAKGLIKVFNKSDNAINIPAGTKIIYKQSSNTNINFITADAIKVGKREKKESSQSAGQETVTYSFGSADVAVTAESIGEEYNIPKDSNLTISSYSSDTIYATTEGLSGGTRKEISIVSAEDVETLTQDALEKSKKEIATEVEAFEEIPGMQTEKKSFLTQLVSKSFDKNVGDESSQVIIKAIFETSVYSYKSEDLREMGKLALSDRVPAGFKLVEDSEKITIDNSIVENAMVKFLVTVESKVSPILNEENIKNSISLKSIDIAQVYLSKLPKVKSYEIKLFPPAPESLRKLPKKENISIQITYQNESTQ